MLSSEDIPELVNKHCVRLKVGRYEHLLPQMREWCEREFGEERPGFPIDEVRFEGVIDYFDGDWCQDISIEYSNDGDREIIFWFWKKDHKAKFQLTWL